MARLRLRVTVSETMGAEMTIVGTDLTYVVTGVEITETFKIVPLPMETGIGTDSLTATAVAMPVLTVQTDSTTRRVKATEAVGRTNPDRFLTEVGCRTADRRSGRVRIGTIGTGKAVLAEVVRMADRKMAK